MRIKYLYHITNDFLKLKSQVRFNIGLDLKLINLFAFSLPTNEIDEIILRNAIKKRCLVNLKQEINKALYE